MSFNILAATTVQNRQLNYRLQEAVSSRVEAKMVQAFLMVGKESAFKEFSPLKTKFLAKCEGQSAEVTTKAILPTITTTFAIVGSSHPLF